MSAIKDMHTAIELAITTAKEHKGKCKWYEWVAKTQFDGVILGLSLMHEMCHVIMVKYDNEKGQLN